MQLGRLRGSWGIRLGVGSVANIKLCKDCKWFVSEDDPDAAKRAWFAMDACICPEIASDLVRGQARIQTCESQRHVAAQVAHIWRIVPELWCGPDAIYFEPKE